MQALIGFDYRCCVSAPFTYTRQCQLFSDSNPRARLPHCNLRKYAKDAGWREALSSRSLVNARFFTVISEHLASGSVLLITLKMIEAFVDARSGAGLFESVRRSSSEPPGQDPFNPDPISLRLLTHRDLAAT